MIRKSDEIRRRRGNWIGNIIRKDKRNIASQLLNGGQKGKEGWVNPKQHGGEWLKMKGKQLGGSHGRMSEPSQQTVVGGKRMSRPYVPYGIKRYSYT